MSLNHLLNDTNIDIKALSITAGTIIIVGDEKIGGNLEVVGNTKLDGTLEVVGNAKLDTGFKLMSLPVELAPTYALSYSQVTKDVASVATSSSNTASSLVLRDASKNIAANDATLSGNLLLPTTSSTVGQIQLNGVPYFHGYSTNSVFAGNNAGNFTSTGGANTGIGMDCLKSVTTGLFNTCVGSSTGSKVTTASNNTSVGSASFVSCTTGGANTTMGYHSLNALTTGTNNTAIGNNACDNIKTGILNVCVGDSAGTALTLADSNNILIGNQGVVGDSNTIRIGTTGSHTLGFIPGVLTLGNVSNNTEGVKFLNDYVSYTPSLLNYYEELKLSPTWSGAIPNTVADIYLRRIGKTVICELELLSATSSALDNISVPAATIPTRFAPVTQQVSVIRVVDDGVATASAININTNGSIVVYGTIIAGPFGGAGIMSTGFGACSFTWRI